MSYLLVWGIHNGIFGSHDTLFQTADSEEILNDFFQKTKETYEQNGYSIRFAWIQHPDNTKIILVEENESD